MMVRLGIRVRAVEVGGRVRRLIRLGEGGGVGGYTLVEYKTVRED